MLLSCSSESWRTQPQGTRDDLPPAEALNAADEHAGAINDVDDIEKFYPGTVSGVREWFRWYKTPDDKPLNAFGFDEEALPAAKAIEVIGEKAEA